MKPIREHLENITDRFRRHASLTEEAVKKAEAMRRVMEEARQAVKKKRE